MREWRFGAGIHGGFDGVLEQDAPSGATPAERLAGGKANVAPSDATAPRDAIARERPAPPAKRDARPSGRGR